ncbi:tRNA wybutosine-synthesizing protein [Lachnellula hyalina]|uniref:tRNA wybutosine-synthesizing protein 2 n=1 Tax=Lachnellula hyalina TaxID=1316788 RepID=A0A8H8R144_9HELO|nr:tRNA wybutosine-synthesizing protein [Lachnellula hyalina]TVY24979.1 tRNA wybutosine-synthesizing protein [Lachnellula hyalina]
MITTPPRPPKPKPANPILHAVTTWFSALPPELLGTIHKFTTLQELLGTAPKRWVTYRPVILLPSGTFSGPWSSIFNLSFPSSHRDNLCAAIVASISKKEGKGSLTHLAINSGIPLHRHEDEDAENILRTPSGLVTLYGDFGPALSPDQVPGLQDFKDAFWVCTKQNGISQTWAPRYTMFSRGNVKEKARLLDFHSPSQVEGRRRSREVLKGDVAVDLYAGIGYFVFSYAALGMRVYGWEINGWSVEGLRRGAGLNGWGVRAVKEDEEWVVNKEEDERIVLFEEDNRKAEERLQILSEREKERVRHVNLGLLPTSEGSWDMALRILHSDGWLHVHENVGVNDVDSRKVEIEGMFRSWLKKAKDEREVKVEHVEFVKTFAPGVWHCVFDVYIYYK